MPEGTSICKLLGAGQGGERERVGTWDAGKLQARMAANEPAGGDWQRAPSGKRMPGKWGTATCSGRRGGGAHPGGRSFGWTSGRGFCGLCVVSLLLCIEPGVAHLFK